MLYMSAKNFENQLKVETSIMSEDQISPETAVYMHSVQYKVSQKNPPWGIVAIFLKRLGIRPNFTCLLCVPIQSTPDNEFLPVR